MDGRMHRPTKVTFKQYSGFVTIDFEDEAGSEFVLFIHEVRPGLEEAVKALGDLLLPKPEEVKAEEREAEHKKEIEDAF